jgi:hypothetical protein
MLARNLEGSRIDTDQHWQARQCRPARPCRRERTSVSSLSYSLVAFEGGTPVVPRMWGSSPRLCLVGFAPVGANLRQTSRLIRGKYNATVRPRNMGRPLQASEAQAQQVLKRHKGGESILMGKLGRACGSGKANLNRDTRRSQMQLPVGLRQVIALKSTWRRRWSRSRPRQTPWVGTERNAAPRLLDRSRNNSACSLRSASYGSVSLVRRGVQVRRRRDAGPTP